MIYEQIRTQRPLSRSKIKLAGDFRTEQTKRASLTKHPMKHAGGLQFPVLGSGIGFPLLADKHDKLLCSWDTDFKVISSKSQLGTQASENELT